MAIAQIELRVAALETEVASLRQRLEEPAETRKHWVDQVYGAFAGDADFLEAMRLGREYRESLKPKPRKRVTKSAAKPSKSAARHTTKRNVKVAGRRGTRRASNARKP
ncbi:MAG: hypothetical protein ACREEM_47215 [Blastocatellia bacterium]